MNFGVHKVTVQLNVFSFRYMGPQLRHTISQRETKHYPFVIASDIQQFEKGLSSDRLLSLIP